MTRDDWKPDMQGMLSGTWAWSTDGKSMTSYMRLANNGRCYLVDHDMEPLYEMEWCFWGWEWTGDKVG